jgi:hypothetical protein
MVYISNTKSLSGLSEVHGVFIGTWKEREDIEDILDMLSTMRNPRSFHSKGLATAITQYEEYKYNLEKTVV